MSIIIFIIGFIIGATISLVVNKFILEYKKKHACNHDYEYIRDTQIFFESYDKMPYKITRTYQCKLCLETKIVQI